MNLLWCTIVYRALGVALFDLWPLYHWAFLLGFSAWYVLHVAVVYIVYTCTVVGSVFDI